MKVTEEIKEGIRKAIFDYGSQEALAKEVSLSKATINRYLNMDVEIRPSNYKKLQPVIEKYLRQIKENQKQNKTELSPDVQFIVDLYGKLGADQKTKAMNYLSSLVYSK